MLLAEISQLKRKDSWDKEKKLPVSMLPGPKNVWFVYIFVKLPAG